MKKLVYVAMFLLAFPSWGMAQEEDRLLQLLKSELEYNMDELRKQELPPYYMSLRVNETYRVDLASSFGAMSSSNETEGRTVVPQIRLGNPELDNFKYMNQGIPAGRSGQTPQGAMLPLGDDAVEGIRIIIHEHDGCLRVQIVEIGKVLRPLFERDVPATVAEVFGKLRRALYAGGGGIDLHQRFASGVRQLSLPIT